MEGVKSCPTVKSPSASATCLTVEYRLCMTLDLAGVRLKLLYTWIIQVIVKQHLVQIGRINGQSENFLGVLVCLVIDNSG